MEIHKVNVTISTQYIVTIIHNSVLLDSLAGVLPDGRVT